MTRWSALQSELHGVLCDDLDLRVHATAYRMQSHRGRTDLPRVFVLWRGRVVWDHPKDHPDLTAHYPHVHDVGAITALVRTYLDTPRAELLTRPFDDPWRLTDLLLASDRRIGRRQRDALDARLTLAVAREIVVARWGPRA